MPAGEKHEPGEEPSPGPSENNPAGFMPWQGKNRASPTMVKGYKTPGHLRTSHSTCFYMGKFY